MQADGRLDKFYGRDCMNNLQAASNTIKMTHRIRAQLAHKRFEYNIVNYYLLYISFDPIRIY